MNTPLKLKDPKLHNLISKEYLRQQKSLELIASENFTSCSVMECIGSILINKYSEGQVGNRYYGGCQKYTNKVVKKMEDFNNILHQNYMTDIENLKREVNEYAGQFDLVKLLHKNICTQLPYPIYKLSVPKIQEQINLN